MKKAVSRVLGTLEEMGEWSKYYDPNVIFREIDARLDANF